MRAILVSMCVAGLLAITVASARPGAAGVELKVGDAAPNFTLQASDGKTYTLDEAAQRLGVPLDAWFPKAFTQGCTIECKSLAANGDKIRKFDVSYFMISVDPLEDNTKFAQSEKADFPMLADPTKQTATSYGVLSERGFANRWTFYIDKSGKIAAIEKMVKPATSAEDMIAKLGELKVDQHHH